MIEVEFLFLFFFPPHSCALHHFLLVLALTGHFIQCYLGQRGLWGKIDSPHDTLPVSKVINVFL